MADSAPTIGTSAELWVGSYRLVQPLGVGGMSSVFRAIHGESGLEVALKILPRSLAKNPTLLQRFLREAKNAESLEHPNIVAIYDRGVDQGRYYLALEYISGGDLHERVRSTGPLKVGEAIAIIKATAQGLNYAAAQGVIHRDVKPANILLTHDGQVKVTDLGLALQVEDEDERVTRDGTTVGTVDYMSPEQARDSRATNVRSDIYSLGCTFYFLLSGTPPFPGGDVGSKLRRHALEAPPDIRRLRPDVSTPLAHLIQRMMAKSPNARFAGYEPLILALDALPASDLDVDGDPQLVPLDDEDAGSSSFLGPGASALNRTVTVEVRPPASAGSRVGAAEGPGGSRSGPSGSRVGGPEAAAPPPMPTSAAPLLREILDEEIHPTLPPPVRLARRGPEASTQEYIVRGVMVGLAIALGGLGIYQVVALVTARPDAARDRRSDEEKGPTPAPGPPDSRIQVPAEGPESSP